MTPAQEARTLLARLGWSRTRAAAELGCHRQTVERWHAQATIDAFEEAGLPAPAYHPKSHGQPAATALGALRRIASVVAAGGCPSPGALGGPCLVREGRCAWCGAG